MIRIGFGTNNSTRAKLIRWATNGEWSHTWIEYPSETWGGSWVVHSWVDGVVSVPVEKVHKEYTKRKVYVCLKDDLNTGFSWASKRVSAKYDFAVIWNALLLVLYRATQWKWLYGIAVRNAARYTCSEFVSGFLKAAGVMSRNVDPEFMTPKDVEKFCRTSRMFR